MKLIHSTPSLVNAINILNQGLKSPKETGKSQYSYTKNSDIICFSALLEEDKEMTTWGDYHFILNPEWVRQNITQFREHGDECSDRFFRRFVSEEGIQPYQGDFKRTWNQILFSKPVPVKGIDRLVIPSSELILLDGIENISPNIKVMPYQKSA